MGLQTLWFVLWGLLWTLYFVLDGFDFGVGMLRVFLARDEPDRRVTLATVGPVWNGNEVWLITAGGATFAAFPGVYASLFSFLYLPMLIILFSIILRGVAMEFREKGEGQRWRSVWDAVLAVSSFTAPLVLGLGFGNIFRGLAFDTGGYHGSFWMLFNPFALIVAVLFVLLFLRHGALWLAMKTEGDLAARSARVANVLWPVSLVVAALVLIAAPMATALLDNYLRLPALFVVPVLAATALLGSRLAGARAGPAFLLSCAAIVLLMATGLAGLFPFLLPSSIDPGAGMTAFNSSSGPHSLRVMTVVALVFVPIVVVYQMLVYRFFGRRVTRAMAEEAEGY
jgi:cytochrome d ubiquinol oxidase subunit II